MKKYLKYIAFALQVVGLGSQWFWPLGDYIALIGYLLFGVGTVLLIFSGIKWNMMIVVTACSIITMPFSAIVWFGSRPSNEECVMQNSVFENSTPESQEYKAELASLLELYGNEDIFYWFRDFPDSNHINVDIRSEHICAIGNITVTEWKKDLKIMKKNNGGGWNGCELYGFKFDIVNNSK